jgi:exosortase
MEMSDKMKKPRSTQKKNDQFDRKLTRESAPEKDNSKWFLKYGAPLVLFIFIWSYWPTIMDIWNIWMRSDEYSSGLLVPILAVYIIWSRRAQLAQCRIQPSLWGLIIFFAAMTIRFLGLLLWYDSAERLSLIICIAALVVLLFGWRLFGKVGTILLFLCLMLPLPKMLEARITLPLQTWATSSAVFTLEVLGYDVIREGNIISIGSTSVAVAEACNGLRMVTAFFVITGLVVLLVNRTWWEKLILLLSALPIGLLCNTIRLSLTSIAFTVLEGVSWEKAFHDYGGFAMMPLALALVVLELWILSKMFTSPPEQSENEKEGILVSRSGY